MITKTRYRTDTGEIIFTQSGTDGAVVFPDESGYGWVEGAFDSTTHKVVNGAAVSKTEEEITAQEIAAAEISFRDERSRRLYACDWTQVPDAPVDRTAWAVYRQELRDLPEHTPDPRYPVWPVPPT